MEKYYEEACKNASEAIKRILDIVDRAAFHVEYDNKAVLQISLPKNTVIPFEIALSLPENTETTMANDIGRKIIARLHDEGLNGNLEIQFHQEGCDSLIVTGTLCIPQD